MSLLVYMVFLCFFFFFKQKTAYEMRISDWSSDVCSSDLWTALHRRQSQSTKWFVHRPLQADIEAQEPSRRPKRFLTAQSSRRLISQYPLLKDRRLRNGHPRRT